MTSPLTFSEHHVDADDFHIRYLEAGAGLPLVVLHGGGGLRVSRSHELLAARYRVILFEVPGFGQSAENTRSESIQDLTRTMSLAATALGLDRFTLLGNSFGGRLALWWAAQHPDAIDALILAAPAALRPEGVAAAPAAGASILFAHPERQPPVPRTDPAILEQQATLSQRLTPPPMDPDLLARLPDLEVPTLVLWGTEDRVITPEMGRVYRQHLPASHLVYLYDAGHALDADRPEAFASVVFDFLDRRDGFLVKNQDTLLYP